MEIFKDRKLIASASQENVGMLLDKEHSDAFSTRGSKKLSSREYHKRLKTFGVSRNYLTGLTGAFYFLKFQDENNIILATPIAQTKGKVIQTKFINYFG